MPTKCATFSKCGDAAILKSIFNLLCRFFDILNNYFVTPVTAWTRQTGWGTGAYVVNSVGTRVKYYTFFNNSSFPRYVKLYNAKNAGDVNPALTVPDYNFMVPANGGENIAECNLGFEDGLVIRVTLDPEYTAIAAPADNIILVNIGYKNL